MDEASSVIADASKRVTCLGHVEDEVVRLASSELGDVELVRIDFALIDCSGELLPVHV